MPFGKCIGCNGSMFVRQRAEEPPIFECFDCWKARHSAVAEKSPSTKTCDGCGRQAPGRTISVNGHAMVLLPPCWWVGLPEDRNEEVTYINYACSEECAERLACSAAHAEGLLVKP